MTAPDYGNTQAVGGHGDRIVIARPQALMSRHEALVQAAWLILVADPVGDDFAEVLAKVQST